MQLIVLLVFWGFFLNKNTFGVCLCLALVVAITYAFPQALKSP